MKNNFKKILTFLIINFTFSIIFYYLIIKGTMNTFLSFGLMWVPGFSAIITQLLFSKSIKGLGWKPGKFKYLLLSFIIPFASCLIVYGIVWFTGTGGISVSHLTKVYSKPLGTVLLIIPTVLLIFNITAALGEEIGWRGFLTAELMKNFSYKKTSFIISVIWFLWHCPIIVFSSYHSSTTPMWYNLLTAFISMAAFTFITVLIKNRSGSLWTAAIFHGSHNLFSQQLFDVITVDYGMTKYITTEFGAGIPIVYMIFAFYLLKRIPSIKYIKNRPQSNRRLPLL